jgi:hypothetical protein
MDNKAELDSAIEEEKSLTSAGNRTMDIQLETHLYANWAIPAHSLNKPQTNN